MLKTLMYVFVLQFVIYRIKTYNYVPIMESRCELVKLPSATLSWELADVLINYRRRPTPVRLATT